MIRSIHISPTWMCCTLVYVVLPVSCYVCCSEAHYITRIGCIKLTYLPEYYYISDMHLYVTFTYRVGMLGNMGKHSLWFFVIAWHVMYTSLRRKGVLVCAGVVTLL